MMRILELFSGTESISKAFRKRGHQTFSIDNDKLFKPDLCIDIMDLDIDTIIDVYDVPQIIWASPPCQCFSGLNCSRHFDKKLKPLTDAAAKSIALVKHTLDLIDVFQPLYWFIENPQGLLNSFSFMKKYPMKRITYCQYGDFRMKPSIIWGKFPKSMIWQGCHYNESCHEAVKVGSHKGTLSLKNSIERAMIPALFCDVLALSCEHDLRIDWNLTSDAVSSRTVRRAPYGPGRKVPGLYDNERMLPGKDDVELYTLIDVSRSGGPTVDQRTLRSARQLTNTPEVV